MFVSQLGLRFEPSSIRKPASSDGRQRLNPVHRTLLTTSKLLRIPL